MPYGVVYLVLNNANDKCYVGQTNRPKKRWVEHCHDANGNKSRKMSLHHAIKKHGRHNFSYEILGEAEDQATLDNLERLWIVVLRANHKQHGYNRTYGGDGAFRHLPETKAKIAEASKAHKHSSESYKRGGEKQRGKIIPQEQRDQISKALTGRKFTEERKAKLKGTRTGLENPFYGKKHSEETRRKLSRPRNLSPEMRAWKSQKARTDMLRIWEERHQ